MLIGLYLLQFKKNVLNQNLDLYECSVVSEVGFSDPGSSIEMCKEIMEV